MGFIGFIGLMRCPVGCRVCRVCRAFKGCRVGRVEGKTEVQTLECKCEKELVDHRSARGCIWGSRAYGVESLGSRVYRLRSTVWTSGSTVYGLKWAQFWPQNGY
eukprot:257737-Rhodomonas_salina.1